MVLKYVIYFSHDQNLGKSMVNLMIDVQPTNEKLKKRAIGIVEKCTGLASIEAKKIIRVNRVRCQMCNINGKN